MAPGGGLDDDDDFDPCEALGLTPVLFWGICDVKYDPRLPVGERVRVLELGDGRSSRFSGHGMATREKFRREYCLAFHYLKRLDVMMENKQLTHDRFVSEGFANLRPRTGCYHRRFEQDLAARICRDLGLQEGDAVVLKLCNRNRGAGVVVAPMDQLDSRLQRLLSPPSGEALAALLEERAEVALKEEPAGDFEEQCLHWWSNEYPCFLAEACCHSLPIPAESSKAGELFDGTLRVAFCLRRPEQEWSDWDGKGLEIDWLGGYWKLPRAAVGTEGGSEAGDEDASLEAVRARVVSSFSTAEKRTAEVEEAHLREVYAALAPALLSILPMTGAVDVQSLLSFYKSSQLVRAFVSARAACSMRRDKLSQARKLLDLARGWVQPGKTANWGLPERSVLSYIERNLAVCDLMEQQHELSSRGRKRCPAALTKLTNALDKLPTNATALFVQGRCFHNAGDFSKAAACMRKALALDPDFKMSYLGLANCMMQLGEHSAAVEASRACLRRHADSPTAQFNMGQAYYHMLREGSVPEEREEEVLKLAEQALSFAKVQDSKLWKPPDESMLRYCLAPKGARAGLPRVPVQTRKISSWRP